MHAKPEQERLNEDRAGLADWRLWGPYLSERQWGTVREDYSPHGAAWDYFPHDHARSRAYRWGEDGLAGVSDSPQRLCVALALWNGRDPILKERLFGLTGPEGNHGEDVKELYYYLDATPTGSYLKYLYKYPQREYPYAQLVEESRRRGRGEPEYELADTGTFDDGRYFDVFVEYAKASPDDLLMRVTVHNRGPESATVHVLPQAWFRNTWSWGRDPARPAATATAQGTVDLKHSTLGTYQLHFEGGPELLFCDNETNNRRLWGVSGPRSPKDAINDCIVNGKHDAVHPDRRGTKVAAHYALTIPAGGSSVVRLRLAARSDPMPFRQFDAVFIARRREADAFYADLQQGIEDNDAKLVQRQALAGMIWSRQFYCFDIPQWLDGDPACPPAPASRTSGRNGEWSHLNNADVISMPDKWEYPWFAAWDLAFHCVPLAMVDPEFAKSQLVLLTREWYMHPNGQLPAYEWAFGDVNPPVHAWATWRVYEIERDKNGGRGDRLFLERVFHKLLLNFTWWVNRKDLQGRNIFQGGFLGLDNIGVFDRSQPLPTGGHINQADGTSWMAMYSLNLMRIALELSVENAAYQDLATKFFEHFLHIAAAMTRMGGSGVDLWDPEDEFFYDVLCLPNGSATRLKVRSMVGLIPLFAVEVLDADLLSRVPEFAQRLEWFLRYRPDLASLVSRWNEPGRGNSHLLSLLRGHRMKRLLKRMLDETEFLSPYGVRALSRHHLDHPYVFNAQGTDFVVRYTPAEGDSGLFGGNSNWRGPIWMPVNYLLIESLRRFHGYYGDDFKVECPTGSGQYVTITEVADELSSRLTRLLLRSESGERPAMSSHPLFSQDEHFRDHLLFHEYFHGDSGRGVGASHQTGWTGLIAALLVPAAAARSSAEPAPAETGSLVAAS
jgi:hypothetical protein